MFFCAFSEICTNTFLTKHLWRLLLYLEPCQISMVDVFWGNSKSLAVFAKNSQMFFKFANSQSFANVLQNRCSKNFALEAPALESLFSKVEGPQLCKFIFKRLQHRCFPMRFAKYLRTLFLQYTSGSCFLR